MRVLMIVSNLRASNGVASFAINYYRTLDHNLVHMDFVCYYDNSDSPYINEIRSNGDEVFVLPPIKHFIHHYKACKKIIHEGKYSIIHNNCSIYTIPLMIAAKRRVRNRILHSHSALLGETKLKEKRNKVFLPILLHLSNNFAACSSKAGKALFKKRKFTIIPNVIHLDSFRYRKDVRQRIRVEQNCEEKVIIGSVGRLVEAKNPCFAIDVIELLVKKHRNICFWWIGIGHLEKEIEEYVHSKGLDNSIILLGNRADVQDLLQGMDIFFLPSKSEGFGLACLEASAAGLPCVVSDEFPSEIDVTGNVRFVSLRQTKQEWAEILLDQLVNNPNRLDANEKIQHSIYSDTDAGKHLYEYYCSLLDQ